MQLGLASSRQDAIGWLSTCSSIRQACLGVYVMNLSVLPSAEKVAHPTELSVKVELDERCFLFPMESTARTYCLLQGQIEILPWRQCFLSIRPVDPRGFWRFPYRRLRVLYGNSSTQ